MSSNSFSHWLVLLGAASLVQVRAQAQTPFFLTDAGWAGGGVVSGGGFTLVAGAAVARSVPLEGGGFALVSRVGAPSTVYLDSSVPVLGYELTARGTLLLKFSGTGTVVVEAAERLGSTPAQTVWTPAALSPGPAMPGALGEVSLGANHRFFRLRRP